MRRLMGMWGLACAAFAAPLAAQETSSPAPLAAAPDPARIPALVEQLGSPVSYDARMEAREALAAYGEAAAPALIEALGHAGPRVRSSACDLLGRLRSAAAAPRLAALLQDPDPLVREDALAALDRVGPPGVEAIRKARADGVLPPAVADAALEWPVRRAVEATLDHCISKDGGWGFYKDQFKDIVALGADAAPVLLRLFTAPEPDYAYLHAFDDEEDSWRVRYRKQVIHRLAGEALVDVKDPSVIPALKAFLESMRDVDPLDEEDPRQDYHEAATFVLMKLGEPSYYEKLKAVFLGASGARQGPDGALSTAFDGEDGRRRRDAFNLARLALLQIRSDKAAAAGKTRDRLAPLAASLTPAPAYTAKFEEALRADAAARPRALREFQGALEEEEKLRQRQLHALQRLAMLQIKADDLDATERTYGKIIEIARVLESDYIDVLFDEDRNGELSEAERERKTDAVDRGLLRSPYLSTLRNAFYNLACACAQRDNKAEALDNLRRAVAAGYEDAEWIQRDRDLDSIKGEPEFKRLIQQLERKRLRAEGGP